MAGSLSQPGTRNLRIWRALGSRPFSTKLTAAGVNSRAEAINPAASQTAR